MQKRTFFLESKKTNSLRIIYHFKYPYISSMTQKFSKEGISRKEALQRLGKYAALTAVGTFLILNPKQAHASSPPDGGGPIFP